ncbi:MAG: TonB family protein [Verrucomicrobiota bacterium]
MKLPKDQPFWTSVILHVVVLLGLFLATVVQAFKPKEKPHVFVVVTSPTEQVTDSSVQPAPPLPDIALPDLPPVPDLVEPVEQTPTPIPQPPAPAPAPRMMTEREFQEQFGTPEPRQQRRATPTRSNISAPRIDVPELFIPSSPSPSNPQPQQLTPQQMSALGTYSAQLRSRIDLAWAKPANLAGVKILATVMFDVSASGRITNARLRPNSGNTSFDQSVLAAFRKVVSAGPTPTGQAHTFTMTFRMQD